MSRIRFNDGQIKVINEAVYHIKHGNNQVYQFAGKAGTGKTFVLLEIIKQIGIPLQRIACMAYIGQAAIVMRTRGLWNAKTIHSTLYHLEDVVQYDENGNILMDPVFNKPIVKLLFRPKPLDDVDYIIIDEAGTVPMSMKHEIERRGKKIIACGDLGQLPPVADKPAYLYDGNVTYLTEIMRQASGTYIPYIADLVSKGIPLNAGLYKNVLVIEEKDLTDEMIKYANIVICGTNRTRDRLNTHIREDILGYTNKIPNYGEKVICRKNNWNIEIDGISLANGLIGSVVYPTNVARFDGKKFYMDFKPDLLDSYFPDLGCDYEYFTAPHEKREYLKNSKYNNGEKFEFAYAITTHLSQGAQYPSGIYFQEYLGEDIQNKLNYVGVTRFSNYLIYVIPNRKSFF